MKEIRLAIKGRVQGVFFRDFVRKKAIALGLVGFVRNLSDGSVEVLVQGEEKQLDELVKCCKKGPMLAKVDDIIIEEMDKKEKYSDFKVLY